MTNILSYHNNSVSGEEILAWAKAFKESDIIRNKYARYILHSSWRNMKNALLLLENEEFDDIDYSIGNNSNYQKHFDYV